jgi:hypothetical protein
VTGTNLTGATSATFGGYAGSHLTVVNDTTLTVTSPPYAAGLHYIQITTSFGTSGKVAAAAFTYEAAPTVTAVSPSAGPTAGGTKVTVTGTGFTGATSATFGGYAGSHLTVVNDTTLTVTSPAYAAGLHYIQITTPAGTSGKVAAAAFTYEAAPTVTAVSPSTGPTSGGTSVTVTGTGFTGATSVTFGGYPGTHLTVINDTTLTVTSPPYSSGLHYIQVSTPGGTSGKVAAAGFTYT